MTDTARRRELTTDYKRTAPAAGVFRIWNTVTGRALPGSATNLASVSNRLAFARSTHSTGALDPRLKADAAEYGFDTLVFEVLDVLEAPAEATPADVRRELDALEALWRERLEAARLH